MPENGGDAPSGGTPGAIERVAWNQEAIQDHGDGTGGVVSGAYAARITQALKPLAVRIARERQIEFLAAWDLLRPWWQRYCNSPAAKFGPESFARNPRQVIEGARQSGVDAMLDALEPAPTLERLALPPAAEPEPT